MEEYPKNMIEFQDCFNTEEKCIKYIEKIRWPKGFVCPKCNYNQCWYKKRGIYQCSNCFYESSITAGTIFQDTKKPLRLWFQAMWHISIQKYGTNALGMQRVLGFGSYHTAWQWLHKLRRVMVRPDREKLSGLIEIDETYIVSARKSKKLKKTRGKCKKALKFLDEDADI